MSCKGRYSKILAIPFSFFCPSLYRDVAKNWTGTGFSYLFMLLFLCWIPIIYFLTPVMKNELTNMSNALQSLPAFTIAQGELSLQQETPFVIMDPVNNELLLVVDPVGKFQNYANTSSLILVTKNNVNLKKLDYQYTFPKDLKIDSKEITQTATGQLHEFLAQDWYAMAAFYVIALLFSLIYRYVQIFFYAILGKAFFTSGITLSFASVMRIASVAITPAVVLFTLQVVFRISVPWENLIYFLITLSYVAFGIRSNRGDLVEKDKGTSA